MRSDRDINRIVRSWLDEGATVLPDRVLDAVLDQLPTTPQRRSWWPARRFADMNVYAKLAMGAAAVVVAAVVGINLLLPGAVIVPGGPAPTPSPTPTATPAPALPSSGLIPPGRYSWIWRGGTVSAEVIPGWRSVGWGIVKNANQSEIGWGPIFPGTVSAVTHVYKDACRSRGALEPIGPTVDELVQALDDQLGSDADVYDVVIGGLPGNRVDLVEAAGLDRSQCRYGASGPLQIWADPGETNFYALGPGVSGRVYAVDVDGDRVLFSAAFGPDAPESDIADFEAMIDSIEFGP